MPALRMSGAPRSLRVLLLAAAVIVALAALPALSSSAPAAATASHSGPSEHQLVRRRDPAATPSVAPKPVGSPTKHLAEAVKAADPVPAADDAGAQDEDVEEDIGGGLDAEPTPSPANSATPPPAKPKSGSRSDSTLTSPEDSVEDEDSAAADRRSLLTASLMIVVSEIGDKTFLVAAIMAMTHARLLVFSAAWAALVLMSVLSALVGNVLPALLSRTYTQILGGILFAVFGVRMVMEARKMEPDEGTEEEMAEVQAEIAKRGRSEGRSYEKVERGGRSPSPAGALNSSESAVVGAMAACKRIAAYVLSPIWVETFVLTFLAEWGDRSQIATIAMGASGHTGAVIVGTVVGHAFCTGLAVVGGKMLAARISVRTVTLIGGISFLLFAALSFIYLE